MLLGPGSLNGESEENFLRLQMAIGERTVADMLAWRSWLHRLEVAVSKRAALCVAVSISGFTGAKAAVTNCTERYVRSNWGKVMIRGCYVCSPIGVAIVYTAARYSPPHSKSLITPHGNY